MTKTRREWQKSQNARRKTNKKERSSYGKSVPSSQTFLNQVQSRKIIENNTRLVATVDPREKQSMRKLDDRLIGAKDEDNNEGDDEHARDSDEGNAIRGDGTAAGTTAAIRGLLEYCWLGVLVWVRIGKTGGEVRAGSEMAEILAVGQCLSRVGRGGKIATTSTRIESPVSQRCSKNT